MNPPLKEEYNPYFEKYIKLVPTENFLENYKTNTKDTIRFFKSIPNEKLEYRYAEGKWTCKEILMHLIDTDRVMSYRALVAMRGDANTPLPPVDEELYARNVDVSERTMDDLLDEFELVRNSAQKLFQNISEEQSSFLANGVNHPVSARAVAFIMQGHGNHHLNIIQERYLV
jgi:uncharacterized damage-inducible protein DinB